MAYLFLFCRLELDSYDSSKQIKYFFRVIRKTVEVFSLIRIASNHKS